MIRPLPTLTNLLALTGVLAASSSAAAASTPAGTVITNQAAANYDPVQPGGPTFSLSNTVSTTVQAVCAVSVTPNGTVAVPGQSASISAGQQTVFKYTITNAGNEKFALPVSPRTEGASNFTPSQMAVYLDSNGNGQLDAGEPRISSVELDANASAKLLLLVQTDQYATGNSYINLVASCGANTDQDNISVVRVTPVSPPKLEVDKTFSPAVVRPGTETTVTVSTTNTGLGTGKEIILTDILTEQLKQGLVLVPGSVKVTIGGKDDAKTLEGVTVEYLAPDGQGEAWLGTPGSEVRGIRVYLPKLAAGEQALLGFRMLATEAAEGKKIENTASAIIPGMSPASDTASADVRYQPGVALGPLGNPKAPEGSEDDNQRRTFASVGKLVCFDHTLQNTGDVQDSFLITISYPQGSAKSELFGADGKPLVQPLVLQPGETSLVRVCYTPLTPGVLEALITVNGSRGSSNTTKDIIGRVESSLPELSKTAVATSLDASGKPVTVPEVGNVAVGDTITYTLTIRNPYAYPLTNVIITDPLPAGVDFVSASENGELSSVDGKNYVVWNLGTLLPGQTRALTIVSKVSERAVDGATLRNVFHLVSTETGGVPANPGTPTDPPPPVIPDPNDPNTPTIPSNPVENPVWNAKLVITKDVTPKVANFGDRLTYTLKIRNDSPTTAIVDALITDTPAKGLEYIAGTSTLEGAATPDPAQVAGNLQWAVATIPAGGEITITYQVRVTAAASTTGELINVVQVVGTGAGGAAKAIASNRAQASVKLDPLKFAPISDIIGTVFVDRNRNGLYDAGVDSPIERARVILSGGRLALTDTAGRYHFSNVPYGTWALRLDPNTTPYPPLKLPQDGGLSGTQTVQVSGLTSVNFPLAPLGGEVSALRRTTLTVGDVRVEKAVYAVQGGYLVTLKITAPRELSEFSLNDPLPGGATLKEGRNTLTTNLPAGETNLTYRFDWTGDPRAATTDPVVSWRY